MSEHMEALGRRWVALGLEWMPGMLTTDGGRFGWITRDPIGDLSHAHFFGPGVRGAYGPWGRCSVRDMVVLVPDFTDRLTELALLHYVQQAWADPRAYVLPLAGLHTDGRWAVVGNPPPGVLERMAAEGYPTWAEACIAALEAAKEVTT